jgi:hypothetical protein
MYPLWHFFEIFETKWAVLNSYGTYLFMSGIRIRSHRYQWHPTANFSPSFASVADTGGKLTADVIDANGVPWLANISTNFRKGSKWSKPNTPGPGGKLNHEKNQKQKILWSCPFK